MKNHEEDREYTIENLEDNSLHVDMDKEYTESDFDAMIIPLYDGNGYPFMDEFEYIDACINNREVERFRNEYFSRRNRKNEKE